MFILKQCKNDDCVNDHRYEIFAANGSENCLIARVLGRAMVLPGWVIGGQGLAVLAAGAGLWLYGYFFAFVYPILLVFLSVKWFETG